MFIPLLTGLTIALGLELALQLGLRFLLEERLPEAALSYALLSF